MSSRVQCKFFVHGACLKGEHCEYSHDWNAQPNNICTFYQKGVCSYGSRCRYDHIKVSQLKKPMPSSSHSVQQETSGPLQVRAVIASSDAGTALSSSFSSLHSASNSPSAPVDPAWFREFDVQNLLDDIDDQTIMESDQSDRPVCSFAASSNCPYGDRCSHIHGDLCSTCGKYCLHPFRTEEREEHIKLCQKNRKHIEALRTSQEIECSVCLEPVLSKPKAAERKFGLLSECDHPFCISCIRNWRSNTPDSGLDVNSALRACPICRKLSYFVIPSVIWYSSKEEKQEIIDNYKSKLKSIDCRHFNLGNGSCPFGTSCFYKHAYRDGRLEEVVLRHLGSEDGGTVIAKNIRLSDFFRDLRL